MPHLAKVGYGVHHRRLAMLRAGAPSCAPAHTVAMSGTRRPALASSMRAGRGTRAGRRPPAPVRGVDCMYPGTSTRADSRGEHVEGIAAGDDGSRREPHARDTARARCEYVWLSGTWLDRRVKALELEQGVGERQ